MAVVREERSHGGKIADRGTIYEVFSAPDDTLVCLVVVLSARNKPTASKI
jgi:hypothetical protein